MELKRVVVTGLGALTPIGNNIEEYWDGLVTGVSGAAPITYFDAAKFKTRFACELKNFDVTISFTEKKPEKWIKFTQYAMVASDEAICDAGLNSENIDKLTSWSYLGSWNWWNRYLSKRSNEFANGDGTPRFNPFFIPKMIADIAPGMISINTVYEA